MKTTTQNTPTALIQRLHLTKKDAICLARELLELAEGNGVNERGTESTHWVTAEVFRGKSGQIVDKEYRFCFQIGFKRKR